MRVLLIAVLAAALTTALAAQSAPAAQAAPQTASQAAAQTAPQAAGNAAVIHCPDSVVRVAVLARPGGDALRAAALCGVTVTVVASAGSWEQVQLPAGAAGWVERKYLASSAVAAGPLTFYTGIVLAVWGQPSVTVARGSAQYGLEGFVEIVVPALGRRYTAQCEPKGFVQSISGSCPRPGLRVGGSYPVRVDADLLWLKQPAQPGGKPQILRFSLRAIRLAKTWGR